MGTYNNYGKFTVTMPEVLSKLGIPTPGRNNFYIECPVCGSHKKRKTLNINLSKEVFRCAKCGAGGGAINMYSLYKTGSDRPNAEECAEYAKEIKRIDSFQVSDDFKSRLPEPVKIERIDHDPVALEVRSDTYSRLMKGLGLSVKHYNNLIDRGLRREDILNNGYRSISDFSTSKGEGIAKALTFQGADLIGVPGFLRNDNGNLTLARQGSGFFIPVRSLEGKIERGNGYVEGLQIRSDNPEDSKYRWLSSRDALDGSGAMTWAHFCGYPEEEVILTEGPLKADIIYRFINIPVIAIPGVNAISQLERMLDLLKSYGTKKIKIAFDMDMYTNQYVQAALENLRDLLTQKGFEIKVLNWDTKYKGYDDFLLAKFLEIGGKLDEKLVDHGQNALLEEETTK